jgi:hypothetical protein
MTDLNVLYTMNVLNEVIAPAHNCDDNLPSLIICRWLCLAEDARPRNKCRRLSLEEGNSGASSLPSCGLP